MVVSKDEIPLDIFIGIQDGMQNYRDTLDVYNLGTVSISSGSTQITLTDFEYINDYSVIKIDDGVNSEIHQLKRHDEFIYTMTGLYDGSSILNNYTNADVYLQFPIEYGRDTLEAIIPGITIWGFTPDHNPTSFELQDVLDTWTSSGPSERREGHYMSYPIQIDCEARQDELLAHLARIVRDFIGRKTAYINGKKYTLNFGGTPVEIRPTEDFDIIPKVLYQGIIEIREELWQRISLPLTTTTNITIQIM
jgi:hypothetical protein